MTLRTLKVSVGLQLVSGVRYGDSARSIILSAMSSVPAGGPAVSHNNRGSADSVRDGGSGVSNEQAHGQRENVALIHREKVVRLIRKISFAGVGEVWCTGRSPIPGHAVDPEPIPHFWF